jgi:hypothetical protein
LADDEPTLPLDLPAAPKPLKAPKRPRPSWRQRAKAVFTHPIKLPGWAVILYVAIQAIPDWKSRLEFWLGVAKSTGGYLAIAATVIASPYFTPSLLAAGLAWVVFAGEAPRGVQRHHWLRYIGWSVVSICLTIIFLTAGYGALTFYIKQEVAKQDIDLQKKYAVGPVYWHLTDAQKIAFKNALSEVPETERFQVEVLCLIDAGARTFVEDLANVFQEAKWKQINANCLFNAVRPDLVGLTLAVSPSLLEKVQGKNIEEWPHDLRILAQAMMKGGLIFVTATYDDKTNQDRFWMAVGNAPR